MKKIIFIGLYVAVFSFSALSSAMAKLDVKPALTLREEYNDNIFLM
ncbi:MAG: hypothetical protein HY753_00920 [Nitrospirae bacterium]|nr:hypothetical protein [Nitrospirota bacterium]